MQTFTSLPLTSQISNPFTQPSKLALLLIPHLETYLSTNPTLRFLILTFPSTHLTTMLCLRKLVGSANLRVANIINSPSSFPERSSSHPSPKNILSNEATIALNARRLPGSRLGTQKAQALLGNAPLPQPLSPPRYAPRDLRAEDDDDVVARYGKPDFVLTVAGAAADVASSVDAFVGDIQALLTEKSVFYAAAAPATPPAAALTLTPPMSGGAGKARKPLDAKAASAVAAAKLGRPLGNAHGRSFESMGLNPGEQSQRYQQMGGEFAEMRIGGVGREKGGGWAVRRMRRRRRSWRGAAMRWRRCLCRVGLGGWAIGGGIAGRR